MKREDLKEGMIIEERDGIKYLISSDKKVVHVDNPNRVYTFVQSYNHDLTYANTYSTYTGWGDIVKVYDENMNLLWERDDVNKDEEEFTNERLKLCKDYYETSPIKFMEDYLGIKLTFWQKSMLNKVINELDNE